VGKRIDVQVADVDHDPFSQALVSFDYQPPDAASQKTYTAWFKEWTKLAVRRDYSLPQVADLLTYAAALPRAPLSANKGPSSYPQSSDEATGVSPQKPSQPYISDEVIARVLRATRVGHNSRNASCRRLASLARSLQALGHRPDFGFMHNFTQSCRFAWTGFTPQASEAVPIMKCPRKSHCLKSPVVVGGGEIALSSDSPLLQEYADLIAAMAHIACPVTIDPLWATEFLAIIQVSIA
jgi:hypothetical protein